MNYTQVSAALTCPVDIERVVDRVRYYSNGKFAFGVLSSGTCFFIGTEGSITEQAKVLLDLVSGAPLDFVVKEMDDHNYIVRFNDKVFSIVFRDEFDLQRKSIEQEITDQVSTEKLISKTGVPPEHLLIGLYGRTRLIRDLAIREIVRNVEVG